MDVLFEDDGQPTPEQAWGVLLKWVRRYGNAYTIPYWRDGKPVDPPELPPMIRQAADDIGGIGAIANSEFLAADRARFIDAYTVRANRRRARLEELPAVTQARKALRAEAREIAGQRLLGDAEAGLVDAALQDDVLIGTGCFGEGQPGGDDDERRDGYVGVGNGVDERVI